MTSEYDDDEKPKERPIPPDPVTAVSMRLTLVQGDQLVAKDRNVLGQWTTSDPYCLVSFFPEGLEGLEI